MTKKSSIAIISAIILVLITASVFIVQAVTKKDLNVEEMTLEQKMKLEVLMPRIIDFKEPINNYNDFQESADLLHCTIIKARILDEPRVNKTGGKYHTDNHTITKAEVLEVYYEGWSKAEKGEIINIVENYYIDYYNGKLALFYPRPYMFVPILDSNKEYLLYIRPYDFNYYINMDQELENKEKWHSILPQGAYLISETDNDNLFMDTEEYKTILEEVKKEFLDE